MSGPVRLGTEGDAALITIDNPPANVLSSAVREALSTALNRAATAGDGRVVLTGAGRTIVAGADEKELSAPPQSPHLSEIVNRIESFQVPVVAEINGAALGGGLELPLACAARAAAPGATFGLPEVTLDIVPDAGGTQRLPRLVGLAAALSLIPEGRMIKTDEAECITLVDAIADEPVEAAREFVLSGRLASDAMPAPVPDPGALEAARMQAAEGLALERDTFRKLKASDQAVALRHVFFAERAAKGQGKSGGGEVGSTLVVGGGMVGSATAYALAQAGITVALVEIDSAGAERARKNVARLYAEAVARGKLSSPAAEAALAARHLLLASYGDLPPPTSLSRRCSRMSTSSAGSSRRRMQRYRKPRSWPPIPPIST